jgi:hypothetical protein
MPDARAPLNAARPFAETFRALGERISTFLNQPLESLRRMALKRRPTTIGRGAAAESPR